jgi:tetratricopeptide (TPR) repeat protein
MTYILSCHHFDGRCPGGDRFLYNEKGNSFMPRSTLAQQLVRAKNADERTRLLRANRRFADEKLAIRIKEICYAAWTSEPARARRAAEALRALFRVNGSAEIEALMCWVSGVADITRGRLEAAIDHLDRAAAIFLGLGREHDSAQTQVAKLIALALLGRYGEAVTIGEHTLGIFEKYGDDLAAGKVEKNLGNIVSRQDQHLKAEKYYLSALKRFIKTGEKSEQIMAETGLAITYTHLHDFQGAEGFFSEALENARAGNMLPFEAGIEASIGNLALFRGRYDEALRFLELSRQKYEELGMPHQTAVAALEIADIYSELNLTPEAMEIYAEVTEVLRGLKLQGEEARARANYGRAAAVTGHVGQARRELRRSARLYEREKNNTGAAAVKLARARLEIDQNRPAKALEIIAEAEKLLGESDSYRHRLTLKLLKAEAKDRVGDPGVAEELLSGVVAEAGRQEQPNIALAALNLLGKISIAGKNYGKAKKYLKRAVTLTEKLRAPLPGEEFRMAFLAGKLGPFENLAAISLLENKVEEAFLYTERARSRSLAEIVSGDSRETFVNDNRAESRKLSVLRDELNWYYSRLNRARDDEVRGLQDAVRRREKQVAGIMRRMESIRENGGGKKEGKFIDLAGLQKQLGESEVLLEFVNDDGVFSAFVVDDKKISFVRGLARTDEILALLEGLQFQFGAMRYGARVPEKFAAELKGRADLYLEKLYEKLLKPLGAGLDEKKLVIVPSGALYYVPFHALKDGENYVIENREVIYTPSAAVWLALRVKPRGSVRNSLLMGYADEGIPLVDSEVDDLKKVLPNPKSYKGQAATFAAYTNSAPDFDLLHLACHAQFRPENPLFSSLHLADGWVTVRDICSQKLKAQLVTLSACETGLNKIFAGDEILGLARGFLSAGASSLVLSLWTVNDEAAARLMHIFYENLQRGGTIGASLRIAQMDFIGRGEHPYYWSPFALIGK